MAAKVNLYVDQGSTFQQAIAITNDDTDEPLDLTIFTISSKMRKHHTSSNSVSFDCQASETPGVLILQMDHATTSTVTAGRYVYDVELYDANSNTVQRIIEGIVVVNPEATK